MKILILVCSVLFLSPAYPQVVGPSDQEIKENRDQAMNLVNTRRKLDQLIWGSEVLAQQYEARIVKLWDNLLQAEQKFAVLAAFPFNSLRLAAHEKSDPLQLRIARHRFVGQGQLWTHAQWKKFIADAVENGYRLEQSEWHHSNFQAPQSGSGAYSEVSFELHIARAEPVRRLIIKGVLDISWSLQGPNADISADTIEVAQMTILDREQKPVFEEVFTVSGTDEAPLVIQY